MKVYKLAKEPPTWGQWLTRKFVRLCELALAVYGMAALVGAV